MASSSSPSSSSTASPSSSSSPPLPGRRVGAFPFHALCALLNGLLSAKRRRKEELILQLWKEMGQVSAGSAEGATGVRRQSLYPLLRLLLPQGDGERSTYGLREAALADVYISALSLDPHSSAALRLKHYRQPQPISGASPTSSSPSPAVAGGDFATVLHSVLRDYEVVKEGESRLTIDDVNAELDALATSYGRDERRRLFVRLLSALSAGEHFFLVRIILRDMKLGIGHETLLRLLHPSALDVFNTTNSLRLVCDVVADPSKLSEAVHTSLDYFKPFKPMLSDVPQHWRRIPSLISGKRYWFEDKYDGERLLIHRKGEVVRLFSRKGLDLAERYHYGAQLQEPLLQALTVDCIVDAELMSWDRVLQRFIPFGNNRTTAMVGEYTQTQLTVLCFDLVKEGDELLIDEPLCKRRQRLERLVVQKEHTVELISTRWVPQPVTVEQLKEWLNDATFRGREGLLLKDADSPYLLDHRGVEWLKFKPDRVEGLHDSFDLILLGGYYGEGVRRGRGGEISHFLLGVAEKVDRAAGARPRLFYSFCKVGSGYTVPELQQLREALSDKWRRYDHRQAERGAYPWLMGWRPEAGEVPDVVIEPQHSILMEVKVYEVNPCRKAKFWAELTCRFPRVVRFRWDKEWYECMDIEEARKLAAEDRVRGMQAEHLQEGDRGEEAANGQSASQWEPLGTTAKGAGTSRGKRKRGGRDGDGEVGGSAGGDVNVSRASAGGRGGGGVLGLFQAADVRGVEVRSSLLRGRVLCVMTVADSGPRSKASLEQLIAAHGGGVSQHPLSSPAFCCILADDSGWVRLSVHKRKRLHDVIHCQWLLDSVDAQQLLPYTASSRYLISGTEATLSKARQHVDQWGDDLDIDIPSVELLRKRMAEVRHSGTAPPHPFLAASLITAPTSPMAAQPAGLPSPSLSAAAPSLLPLSAAVDAPRGYRSLRSGLSGVELQALRAAAAAAPDDAPLPHHSTLSSFIVDVSHLSRAGSGAAPAAVSLSSQLAMALLRLYGAELVHSISHSAHCTHIIQAEERKDEGEMRKEEQQEHLVGLAADEVAGKEGGASARPPAPAIITADWVIERASEALRRCGEEGGGKGGGGGREGGGAGAMSSDQRAQHSHR